MTLSLALRHTADSQIGSCQVNDFANLEYSGNLVACRGDGDSADRSGNQNARPESRTHWWGCSSWRRLRILADSWWWTSPASRMSSWALPEKRSGAPRVVWYCSTKATPGGWFSMFRR